MIISDFSHLISNSDGWGTGRNCCDFSVMLNCTKYLGVSNFYDLELFIDSNECVIFIFREWEQERWNWSVNIRSWFGCACFGSSRMSWIIEDKFVYIFGDLEKMKTGIFVKEKEFGTICIEESFRYLEILKEIFRENWGSSSVNSKESAFLIECVCLMEVFVGVECECYDGRGVCIYWFEKESCLGTEYT